MHACAEPAMRAALACSGRRLRLAGPKGRAAGERCCWSMDDGARQSESWPPLASSRAGGAAQAAAPKRGPRGPKKGSRGQFWGPPRRWPPAAACRPRRRRGPALRAHPYEDSCLTLHAPLA
eukprot:scaffold2452_cov303-Prasinococcus_capsulatus_cf.AAC.2